MRLLDVGVEVLVEQRLLVGEVLLVRGEQLTQRRHAAQLREPRERRLAPLVLLVKHSHL